MSTKWFLITILIKIGFNCYASKRLILKWTDGIKELRYKLSGEKSQPWSREVEKDEYITSDYHIRNFSLNWIPSIVFHLAVPCHDNNSLVPLGRGGGFVLPPARDV